MKYAIIVFCLWLFAGYSSIIYAHAVNHRQVQGGLGVEIAYDDGTPMSYSEYKVFSPADREKEFQQGQTDKNGRLFFCPDIKGAWRIEVNDGLGHGEIIELPVTGDLRVEHIKNGFLTRFHKILIGVSIIVGLTGIFFYWSARRKLNAKPNNPRSDNGVPPQRE